MSSSPLTLPLAKRVTARRGSTSASDPYGRNARLNENPNRATASTLTIVRVPQPPPGTNLPVQEPRRFGSHRRIGSNPNISPSVPHNQIDSPTRISFASASFGGLSQTSNAHGAPTSPSSSPRLRPASPRSNAPLLPLGKPRLTPDQLVDLARQSLNPRYLQQQTHGHSANSPSSLYSPSTLRPGFPSLQSDTPLPVDPDSLPVDSTKWGYPQLYAWLTRVDRDIAPDPLWVLRAKKCVVHHSELIWERMKGALGVPPELDMDADEIEGYDSGSSSLNTDEISDDEGRKARGHWEDWDAIIDSPVFDREQGKGGSPVASRRQTIEFASRVPLPGRSTTDGETTSPHIASAGESPPTISHRLATLDLDQDVMSLSTVSIEPLLTSSSTSSANPPPLSLPLSVGQAEDPSGLGDIAEGTEEEEEEAEADASGKAAKNALAASPKPDPHLIHPSQIQGLKISTNPLSISGAATAVSIGSPLLGPSSPGTSYSGSVPHSRSPSVGSLGSLRAGFLRRSDSFGSVISSGTGPFTPGVWDDTPYDPVGDRAPGNPLFPSNFARLAVGPTLAANNHSLRHPMHPPLSRYTPHHGGPSPSTTPSVISAATSPLVPSGGLKARTYSHGVAVGYIGVGKDATRSVPESSASGGATPDKIREDTKSSASGSAKSS
ncbi:hypothetical protein AX16_001709 [Volvariella volvacea WC 439]|nr:hypothetical protein AX16_001709 [Volvariella volvacea WC 439]